MGQNWRSQCFCFEIIDSGRAIQVYCDGEGMATLVAALEKIRSADGHGHLCTPSNGGHELSEKTPYGNDAVREIIVTWSNE
jgi:hypothetical protein